MYLFTSWLKSTKDMFNARNFTRSVERAEAETKKVEFSERVAFKQVIQVPCMPCPKKDQDSITENCGYDYLFMVFRLIVS